MNLYKCDVTFKPQLRKILVQTNCTQVSNRGEYNYKKTHELLWDDQSGLIQGEKSNDWEGTLVNGEGSPIKLKDSNGYEINLNAVRKNL